MAQSYSQQRFDFEFKFVLQSPIVYSNIAEPECRMLKCATAAAPAGGSDLALIGDAICTLLISGSGPSWATAYAMRYKKLTISSRSCFLICKGVMHPRCVVQMYTHVVSQ